MIPPKTNGAKCPGVPKRGRKLPNGIHHAAKYLARTKHCHRPPNPVSGFGHRKWTPLYDKYGECFAAAATRKENGADRLREAPYGSHRSYLAAKAAWLFPTIDTARLVLIRQETSNTFR